MTSQQDIAQFIEKWGPGGAGYTLNERQGAQQHFIELCSILGVPPPVGGIDYLFEKQTLLHGQKRGFADVFKRGHFAWEYKAPGGALDGALRQLMMYALALDNPPLLIVSDRLRIIINTHFNGTPSQSHSIFLSELNDPAKRQVLRRCFLEPESFRPALTNRQITEDAAEAFVSMALRMRAGGIAPNRVSHFLTQCVFSFFAEDVGLLPSRLFDRLVNNETPDPSALRIGLQSLFEVMRDGGLFGAESIPWFNGGLFQAIEIPELSADDVRTLRTAARLDWSAVDPSIFGTLFERGLDPKKRSQLGAHYTDPTTIARLIEPVITRPLRAAWDEAKCRIDKFMAKRKVKGDADYRRAERVFVTYLQELQSFKILDPACGSGNFLFLALKALKDLEHQANIEAEDLGLQRQVDSYTGPSNLFGIEINEYAAELARVTVWIGELQWRLQHGYPFKQNPVLDPLNQIECRDALLEKNGTEAKWPKVAVVVGNPPFVGVGRKRRELGEAYLALLERVYSRRVPGGADFVCYWFEKALNAIRHGNLKAAGLVATNSIRGGASRKVLDQITKEAEIFDAWSDEAWVNEGAAVRVSLVCFGKSNVYRLNGQVVPQIYSDLTAPLEAGDVSDVTQALALRSNLGVSFQGASKKAKFEIDAQLAREWLLEPNPSGCSNADVVKPWANGFELSRRPQEQWIVDFGNDMTEAQAARYEKPFEYIKRTVEPERAKKSDLSLREYWWRFGRPRVEMREALIRLPRFIATVAHSKYRAFRWLHASTSPDQALIVFARADDTMFGILHSRFHEAWSLRMGTSIGVGNDPRYTPTTCFETFPFPLWLDLKSQATEAQSDGLIVPADLGDDDVKKLAVNIAKAANHLDVLRETWLNPPEWTVRVPEVVPVGMQRSPYPDRIVARAGCEKKLAGRTVTELYNLNPTWLVQAHQLLDSAVAEAYGWNDYSPQLTDAEIVKRLLTLNRISADWAENKQVKSAGLRLAQRLQQTDYSSQPYGLSELQEMAQTDDRKTLTNILFYLVNPQVRLLRMTVLIEPEKGEFVELPKGALEDFSKGRAIRHPLLQRELTDEEIFIRFSPGAATKELR